MSEPSRYDALVLGAGAAGLFCAALAGQRGRRVAVLDHNQTPGRKILISGGGRANFTNLNCTPDRFLSANPHFSRSALARYTPHHFLELVNRHDIAWHEKTLGQLFCDHSARDLLNMLLSECDHGHVDLHLHRRILSVEHRAGEFHVATTQGNFAAQSLVVATGGLSIPSIGATAFGYDIARQFGLRIVPTRPALVPLTLGGEETAWSSLTGIAAAVKVSTSASRTAFDEKMLFTHRGLSGPAILQISSHWSSDHTITVDFAPGLQVLAALREGQRDESSLRQALRNALPARLADHLCALLRPQRWTNASLDALEHALHHFEFHPTGTEGYAKAEVTAGGVNTDDLSAKTMAARSIDSLFFIGEVVDVTGQLGGYNFQWAWSSAAAAAQAL